MKQPVKQLLGEVKSPVSGSEPAYIFEPPLRVRAPCCVLSSMFGADSLCHCPQTVRHSQESLPSAAIDMSTISITSNPWEYYQSPGMDTYTLLGIPTLWLSDT